MSNPFNSTSNFRPHAQAASEAQVTYIQTLIGERAGIGPVCSSKM